MQPACPRPQVDTVGRGGERTPVSVWMKRVKREARPCCVVVLEPVERVSAWVSFRGDVSLLGSSAAPPPCVPGFAHPALRVPLGSGGPAPSAEPALPWGEEPRLLEPQSLPWG